MSVSAEITNVSRASLHDGNGVRTVVYFKGCNLSCKWCHNPETISHKKQVIYTPVRCICCGRCIELCPECHTLQDGKMKFLFASCSACGRCVDACPSGALRFSGNRKTVDELMHEIRKDLHYYRQSNGGVTLSGGECLLQSQFCEQLLKACKNEHINTLIETALFVAWSDIERVLPYCDEFFADFKIPDPEKHKRYTGHTNRLIVENLQKLAGCKPGKITVRIPLIPGVNDAQEDVEGFAKALLPIAEKLCAIEILRYNDLAKSKYEFCGKEYTDFGQAQSDERLLEFCGHLQAALSDKTRVFATV